MADAVLGEDAVVSGRPAKLGDHRFGPIEVELVELFHSRVVVDVGRGDRSVERTAQVGQQRGHDRLAVDRVRHRLPHRQLVEVEVGAHEIRAEDVARRLAEGRNREVGVRLEPGYVLQCGVAQGVDLGVLDANRALCRLEDRLPANAVEVRRAFVGEVRHDRARVVLPARHRHMTAWDPLLQRGRVRCRRRRSGRTARRARCASRCSQLPRTRSSPRSAPRSRDAPW